MSDLNIIPGIFNTYKSFSDCSTDEVSEGLCPWIENPYKREDICNYLIHRAITVRFPNLCPFTSGPGAELFELMLMAFSILFLLICFISPSLEEEEAEWEREQMGTEEEADECEYESKKRKRE